MTEKLTCRRCKTEITSLIDIRGVELIQFGGVGLRDAHGVCLNCGEPFHYTVSDKVIERIGRSLVADTDVRRNIIDMKFSGRTWTQIASVTGRSVSTCKRIARSGSEMTRTGQK